ncbi:fibronectin type III domain-containing protein [Nitrosopumilus sp.]|uniref:fibronectin type III domain-containing protein n=1 Tax=Nitrosopumilus sp. TaxID=2024843 RepID=UPI003D0A7BAE
MATVRITKTSVEDFGTETFIMQSNQFKTLRINLNTPMFVQDIPQTSEEQTIVIKVTGNVQRIYYSFPINKLDTNLVTSGLASGIDTTTVDGQMGFLLNEFRPTGIEDSYQFEIISPSILNRICTLEDLDISFEEDDPVNPICNMVFVVGDVQTTIDENVPQRPPTNLSVSDVSGNPRLTWTNVASADEGGSSITGYKVERRSQIGSWETLTSAASTPYDDTGASDTTGVIYKYRVSAVNSAGAGKATNLVKHTRP